MTIDNDIKAKPKLTVVGKVIVNSTLFTDQSKTMNNMTVSAWRGEVEVEKHSCMFVNRAGRSEYFYEDVLFCNDNGNWTKFDFNNLEVAKKYKFHIEACNHAGCAVKTKDHNTQNWLVLSFFWIYNLSCCQELWS